MASHPALPALLLAAAALASGPAPAPAQTAHDPFIRFTTADGAARLETAVVEYGSGEQGPRVVLVAAVHIADQGYYELLQTILDGHDAVLYEGVRGLRTENLAFVTRLQLALRDLLGLRFQGDAMDMSDKRFIHADMDSAELEARLAAKGVGLLPGENALKALGPMMTGLVRFLDRALRSTEAGDRAGPARNRLKVMVARMLGSGVAVYDRLKGPGEKARDEVIIGARNDVAWRVLGETLRARGDRGGPVSIIYGAAHMPDLAKRVTTELGLRETSRTWLTAWEMRDPSGRGADASPGDDEADAAESGPAPAESAPASRPARKL